MTNMPMNPMGQMNPMGTMNYPSSFMPNQGMNGRIQPRPQPTAVTAETSTDINKSLDFLNGYLRTQVGKKVTVEFLIGTNTLLDRTGTLLAVGTNYILINELETDDVLACDFYNIKFVKIYR